MQRDNRARGRQRRNTRREPRGSGVFGRPRYHDDLREQADDLTGGRAGRWFTAVEALQARLTRIPRRLHSRLGPLYKRLLLIFAGAATGAVLVATAVGLIQAGWPERHEIIPPPPQLPDYVATIQAPTPTPGGPDNVPETTVSIDNAEIERFVQWMISRTWLAAANVTAQADDDRLIRLVSEPDTTEPCRERVVDGVAGMVSAGRMLEDTSPIVTDVAECLQYALERPPIATSDADHLTQGIVALLHDHAHAANGVTELTARTPSPDNVAFWRTVWPHQNACRSGLDIRAGRVINHENNGDRREALAAEFTEIEQCLDQAARRVANGFQSEELQP